MGDRPQPFELWRQATDEIDAACRAGGDPHADPTPRYLELLREHGHVVPADHPDAGGRNLPCGWPGERAADLAAERPDWEAVADQLAEAIRLTREYVGEAMLPEVEGWSHHDAVAAYRRAKLAMAEALEGEARALGRGNRLVADLLATAAVVDDRSSEVVVLHRDALFQFLGQVALPPHLPDDGSLAARLVDWVETHRL